MVVISSLPPVELAALGTLALAVAIGWTVTGVLLAATWLAERTLLGFVGVVRLFRQR